MSEMSEHWVPRPDCTGEVMDQETFDTIHNELDEALAKVMRAKHLLFAALHLPLHESPNVNTDMSNEIWQLTRLAQNVSSAELHLSDRYGS